MKAFISYSSKDINEAEKICTYLESKGKVCWIAPRNIAVGKEYGEEIIRGIENSNVFVLVYSQHSNSSQHVLREVERAVSKKIPIITYALDNTPTNKSLEYFLLSTQFLDATKHKTATLQLLSESIDQLLPTTKPFEKATMSAPDKRSLFKRNKIAFILGAIAIGVAAIAIALFMNGSNLKNNGGLGTDSSKTVAVNNAEGSEAVDNAGAADEAKPKLQTGVSAFTDGDYISFGRYYPPGYSKENNDGEIIWVIADINEQSGELTLVSQFILDIMPYDTAESGKFDKDKAGNSYDRNKRDTYALEQLTEFRGSSDWETSNIRTWLNSSMANVKYDDSAPVDRGSDEFTNGYDTRSGFLHDFQDHELAMLQEKEINTSMNALELSPDKKGFENPKGKLSEIPEMLLTCKATTDRVFLLSVEEVKKYGSKETFQPFTKPTASAAASDKSIWLKSFISNGDTNYMWATRTPEATSSELLVAVLTGTGSSDITNYYAAASGFGIRPAVVIKPADFYLLGEGSSTNPYAIKGK
ncbi:MAG: toll/interleukin-1 receptor domain-containing protein [Ruminiclostridium sp.]|nr:toll/interleukin-1 receptor domain-containing protein [Ruminiclostridium sp.]